ncbi:MAG: sigma-E processing peptidase SpoIIGA [Oscillospiraceae bacterium]|nr:sigma-E processing peptidase SpoIIGA [Oscillospiraceae bacterium]
MQIYLDLMILLNFVVDLLLLLAVNRLCGYPVRPFRSAGAAGVGAVYAAVCILPGYRFMSGLFWRVIFLCIMSVVAFGWNRSTLRRGVLLIFLSMALGGVAGCIGRGGFWGIVVSAAAMLVLCRIGFYGGSVRKTYVPVELRYRGKKLTLVALRDTGNLLSDPVTGQKVLVTGPEIAWDVAGLTPSQLAQPVETISQCRIPGLRLIPYRCVGQSCGMLLAMNFDSVKVAGIECGHLVAFTPNGFGAGSEYQALSGGEI